MAKKKVDDKKGIEKEPNSVTGTPSGRRTRPILKSFLLILVPVIAAGAAYRAGLLEPSIEWLKSFHASREPATVLTGLPVQDLLSSRKVLTVVGKSALDPAHVLLGSFEKSGGSDGPVSLETCPPESFEGLPQADEVRESARAAPGSVELPRKASVAGDKAGSENPTIVTRRPAEKDAGDNEEDRATSPASVAGEAHRKAEKESARGADTPPVDTVKAAETPKKRLVATPVKALPQVTKKGTEKATSVQRPKSGGEDTGAAKPDSGPSDAAKMERFQLPGALVVKIASYEGSVSKWGIMVILDNGISMARKSKPWSPNRGRAAATLVEKLPDIMTPGSRLAVRDFLCGKSTGKNKGKVCLSHMLYDWSGAPFKDLRQSLERVSPQGWNNPCAAAAYAVKRDLSGLGGLSARVLVLTDGTVKCPGLDVMKAIDRYRGDGKVALDVIALGMHQKYSRGYALAAKKTGGVFLRVNGSDDLDRTLARYKKVLRKRTLEPVEVRGENAVYTVIPGEEITLAPGSYSVVLPLIGSLKASKRTIANVTIKSAETKVVEVRIRKGTPLVRFAQN
ncbi:MAG: hypothetical protein RDU20_05365 [Desulfomonilaceae bacterium]|nr:hypothetical protein [Desulfomonilaceae bacterium]